MEKLVDLMTQNSDIARGKLPFGYNKMQLKDKWDNFTELLNALGPPIRNTKEWQRVKTHYKANLKRKLAANKKNFQATGGVNPNGSAMGLDIQEDSDEVESIFVPLEASTLPEQHSPERELPKSSKREKPKKLQTQQRQFEILVDFMEQHSDLAKGQLQCGNAKQRANNLWTKLADDLNSNGPPVRDVAGWKKVWSDLKTHTKVKMRKNKISISSTGGGVSQYCPLSSMEEQIINLLQMEEAVNGRATSTYFGTSSNVSHDVSANKEPAEEVLLSSQNENYSLSESAPADKRSC
ncbi:hypothetical protein FF38_10068 [Lucilia cuprina]|uniref:Regulatory protein zeste n=1 Tax=Lucilia cuprina TaxID=7375 RepID=A0A0L0BSY9_LUCCU|nr:hypothetical protein FF38_10068 [Lucilia cuprina]